VGEGRLCKMRVLLLYLSCALFPGFFIPGLIFMEGEKGLGLLIDILCNCRYLQSKVCNSELTSSS